jgi:hypothetical protein
VRPDQEVSAAPVRTAHLEVMDQRLVQVQHQRVLLCLLTLAQGRQVRCYNTRQLVLLILLFLLDIINHCLEYLIIWAIWVIFQPRLLALLLILLLVDDKYLCEPLQYRKEELSHLRYRVFIYILQQLQ